MASLQQISTRWNETVKHSATFADLQRAVKFNGSESPCVAGCRSVCWKAFLIFRDTPPANWPHILLDSRNTYSTLREHYLLYIKHPEKLAELSVDPLADDPNDELVRAEILQDVRRLPDEPAFYHHEATQMLILDVLFLWCKTHPEAGGYRQGMHELLAPMVYAVHQDALDRSVAASAEFVADSTMVEMLDSYFVEHDSFALFSAVMNKAKAFYQVGGDGPSSGLVPAASTASEQSAIVERSREIHEVMLMKVDPELANHLKSIDILPQIFLIRWIRLLFGREFPFEQQLTLWDTMFAFDPSLGLIDLICVSMLIRIRWTLLEADYSSALQTLLKYPAPLPPHGPHTFVDDAAYLRDHLSPEGGSALIIKYTGRAPTSQPRQGNPATPAAAANTPRASRPSTPGVAGNGMRSSRSQGVMSPSSAARFLQQQTNVEALFQGAVKGFMERGERLGLNQAVRDAAGEIRRNVQQGIQEARKAAAASSARSAAGGALGISSPSALDDGLPSAAALARRNRELAAMLEQTITDLRALASTAVQSVSTADESARSAHKDAIEMAAARVQFVQVYLEDSTLMLPDEEPEHTPTLVAGGRKHQQSPSAVDAPQYGKPLPAGTAAVVDAVRDDLRSSPTGSDRANKAQTLVVPSPNPNAIAEDTEEDQHDRMDTDDPPPPETTANTSNPTVAVAVEAEETAAKERPPAPIPTRSTIAQSSFSWMLEPDMPPSSAAAAATFITHAGSPLGGLRSSRNGPFSSSAPPSNRKRMPASGGRERNAFLFGEVTTSEDGGSDGRRTPVTSDEIFGLQPLRNALPRAKSP